MASGFQPGADQAAVRVAHVIRSSVNYPLEMRLTMRSAVLSVFAACTLVSASADAQSGPVLTLGSAVDAAAREYPSVIEARARAVAAAAAIDEAQAAYVPRLDALWQLNLASRNNVFGLLLPQAIVPPISGPVLGTDSFDSTWGSAAGLLFSTEVFDFGRRAATLAAARADAASMDAQADAARLDAAVVAADSYLSALGAQQVTTAAQANVARLEVIQRTVKAQVDAELKPGADQSRVEAELAAARNRLIAAEQASGLARLRLAAAIGLPESAPTLEPGSLLEQQPGPAAASGAVSQHPAVRAAEEAIKAAEARLDSTSRLFRPKLFFNAAVATRASGANVDGTFDHSRGLWPDVPNWAAGITVTFPFLDMPAQRGRLRAQSAQADAAQARLAGTTQRSRTEVLQARVMIDAATRMATNIPAQLTAARQADAQARARYAAGLTGITEVADAQRLLAQAETEEALATLALWRARLAEAAAEGDLAPFLAEAAKPSGPRVKP